MTKFRIRLIALATAVLAAAAGGTAASADEGHRGEHEHQRAAAWQAKAGHAGDEDREDEEGRPAPFPPVKTAAPAASTPAAAAAPAPAPAPASPAQQAALINQDRAANGLPPLQWNDCLAQVARSNASRIASESHLSHANGVQQDFSCGLGSSQTGENVGDLSGGPDDAAMNQMFMNSPEHRANILGSAYHYVGTAWVTARDGTAYMAVEFA